MATNKVGKKGKQNRNAGKHPSYKKRKMSKESIEKKRKYDTQYHKKKSSKLKRADANRKRRQQRKKGNKRARIGSNFDFDHHTGRMERRSKNRGRNSKTGGTSGDRRARG